MRRGYADTPVGQIHYREAGAGGAAAGGVAGAAPVVLLHMTASSSTLYERAAPLLAASGRRVIAMDTPGFGLSDPPPGPDGSIAHYGRAVVGLLDALGIAAADIVGFHTGATIGLELAVARPERVRSLVLAAAFMLEADGSDRQRWRDLILVPWVPDGRGDFLGGLVDWLRLYVPPGDGEFFRSELISRLQAGTDNWWAPNGVIDFDAAGALREVRCPLAFLNPVDDNLAAATRRAAALRPDAPYVEMPGADGAPMTHPAEFAAAVGALLDTL